MTVYLPDGTPYRATVSAVYARSLPLGDLLIPASVAAGHTGSPPGYSQILVTAASPGALALTAGHPGVTVASRQVYDAQIQRSDAQQSFGDLLILGVIAALAAVTLVNTLAVATFERRRSVRLLARTGATARQVAGDLSVGIALFVTATGSCAGALMAAGTLAAVDKAITGTPVPYIPPTAGAVIIGSVAVLATGTIMASLRAMTGQRG